jgi:hypothetical protein
MTSIYRAVEVVVDHAVDAEFGQRRNARFWKTD